MSTATSCTSCGTVFRVVQDQLKVSEGWVRCGRCRVVFNALEGLFDLDPDTAPGTLAGRPQPLTGNETAHAPNPPGAARGISDLQGFDPGAERHDPSLVDRLGGELFPERQGITGVRASSRFTAIESTAFKALRRDSDLMREQGARPRDSDLMRDHGTRPRDSDLMRDRGARPRDSDLMRDKRRARSRDSDLMPDNRARLRDSGLQQAESELLQYGASDTPEFLRRGERATRWHRPWVRGVLSSVLVSLLVALALQIVHHWRDEIAAGWRGTRPLLARWCELASCAIDVPRHIEDIAVESTGFARIAGADQFRLSLVLRNRSALALAMPWVELSLTDASGSLLARKALSPMDFLISNPVLEPGSETQMQLVLAAGTPLVTGYTVEIFYP